MPRLNGDDGENATGSDNVIQATTNPVQKHDQDQRRVRKLVSEYISAAERANYTERSPVRSIFTLSHIWLALTISFWLVTWLTQQTVFVQICFAPLLVLFIGTRINALAVQVHEGSHGCLMKSKTWNDWFCNLGAGWWVLNDVTSYWKLHSVHHNHLLEVCDPDRDLYSLPERRRQIVGVLIQDLLWITAARRISQYLNTEGKQKNQIRGERKSVFNLFGKLSAQALIVGLFAWQFGIQDGFGLWFLFWAVPLFSVFPLLIRMRLATEHYSETLHSPTPFDFVSRTSTSFKLEEYLIGAQMEYHMEHHLFPNIPYHQLKRMHHRLLREGTFDAMPNDRPFVLSGGYLNFWWSIMFGNGLRNSHSSPLFQAMKHEQTHRSDAFDTDACDTVAKH